MAEVDGDELAAEISEEETLAQINVVSKKVVTIVVLGDIGRSPRMAFHALSLAREGYCVHLVGYGGTELPKQIQRCTSIHVSFMREPPRCFQDLHRLIAYPAKIVWQWLFLSWVFLWVTLVRSLTPDFIMVQNPPSVPTLPLTWLYSKIYRCPLVIDWHNYGYTLMALNLGRSHRVTKMYELCEMYFGAKGTHHLCVTNAMKNDLRRRIGIDAVAFHDRPADKFRPLDRDERKEFLQKLSEKYPNVGELIKDNGSTTGMLVSSTSWTEDENFAILLTALTEYDKMRRENPESLPKLIVFITGKGPQKEYYSRMIDNLSLREVEIHLPWLDAEDYPRLLACADLGVSLHTSSSGLDLPMKVVDMFGCGLPVAAIHFPCISELVQHMHNGLVFSSASDLAQQIQDWFSFETNIINRNREKFRESLRSFQAVRWHASWTLNVLPIFK